MVHGSDSLRSPPSSRSASPSLSPSPLSCILQTILFEIFLCKQYSVVLFDQERVDLSFIANVSTFVYFLLARESHIYIY